MESNFVGGRLPALGGLSQESVRSRWINLALIVVLVGGLSYSGRAAAGTGPQVQLAASQSPLDFGDVSTGTNKTKTITLTNSGSASIRLSRAHVSGSSFKVSGLSLPLTLGPKQNTTFSVVFAPGRTGNIGGSVSLVSNDARYATTIVLSGTGVQRHLWVNPSSASFGNVGLGTHSAHTITLTNPGPASVTVYRAYASGSGFSMTGLRFPLKLGPGQKTAFSVVFAPVSKGSVTGRVFLVSHALQSTTTIPLTGTGVQPLQSQLSVIPPSASFGNVGVGTRNTYAFTLTNSGSASVTVSQANVSGSGLSVGGLSLPLTLAPGQKTTFSVVFAPATTGNITGSVSLVSNAPNSPTTIALSGIGVQPLQPQLSVTPPSASFGNVGVGTRNTYAFTLTNSGSASVTVSQANVSGSGLSVGGLSLPLTLTPGQKTTFSVVFAPASTGNITGSVSLVSNALNSPTTIALSGTAVQPQLSVIPPSASFGNVGVGTRNTYAFTLTNSGSASVTVSQANVSGSGLSVSGLSLPLTLTPGQKTTFSVVFAPATTGNMTGSVSLVSNAPNSPTTIAMTGTAVQPQLSVVPPSASFGDVAVGTRNTQTITLINSGTGNMTISQATPSGNGFSMTGLTVPLTLSAGQRTSFNVAFAPASAGSITGSLSLVSDAPK